MWIYLRIIWNFEIAERINFPWKMFAAGWEPDPSLGLKGTDLTASEAGLQSWFWTHCVTLCHTVLHCVTLCYTVSHCVTLCHTVSHCVTLCHTVSHCDMDEDFRRSWCIEVNQHRGRWCVIWKRLKKTQSFIFAKSAKFAFLHFFYFCFYASSPSVQICIFAKCAFCQRGQKKDSKVS